MFFKDYAKVGGKQKLKKERKASVGRKGRRSAAVAASHKPPRKLAIKLRYWLIMVVAGYLLINYGDTLLRVYRGAYAGVEQGAHYLKDFFEIPRPVQYPLDIQFYPVRDSVWDGGSKKPR